MDIEPYYESFLKSRLAGTSIEDKVGIMIGPAEKSLEKLHKEGKRFDFIFIDANKGGYPSYYKVSSWSLLFSLEDKSTMVWYIKIIVALYETLYFKSSSSLWIANC